MRTARYRGKSDDRTSMWVYGSLLTDNKTVYAILSPEIQANGKLKFRHCDVDPETIGQFTGLLDKNGREIYEGDILNVGKEWDGNTGSIKVYNEIGIKNGCFGYIGEHSRELLPFCHHEVTEEIAGNIYDNPELLKGGSNER